MFLGVQYVTKMIVKIRFLLHFQVKHVTEHHTQSVIGGTPNARESPLGEAPDN